MQPCSQQQRTTSRTNGTTSTSPAAAIPDRGLAAGGVALSAPSRRSAKGAAIRRHSQFGEGHAAGDGGTIPTGHTGECVRTSWGGGLALLHLQCMP